MKLISLDIETYGACRSTRDGRSLPSQTVFNPARSLHTDSVSRQDLVLSVAITTEAHSCPCRKRSDVKGEWAPCCTMVFFPDQPGHNLLVNAWLDWATDILGMNLPFDLGYMRTFNIGWRFALSGRHTLHDLSILNYLHSELRPERSLKSLGPVLGTHIYTRTIKDGKFKSPHDKEFVDYAAQDTHNTMLAANELRRRIRQDWGPTSDKISPAAITHYSDLIWTVVSMAEAGIPMDTRMLVDRARMLSIKSDLCLRQSEHLGLLLEGTGSTKSKEDFIHRCVQMVYDQTGNNLLDHPLMRYTDKTKKISWSDGNRQLVHAHLPPQSPEARGLWVAGVHSRTQKQLSSYLYPLLVGRRNKPEDKGDTVIPWKCPSPQTVTSPSTCQSPAPMGNRWSSACDSPNSARQSLNSTNPTSSAAPSSGSPSATLCSRQPAPSPKKRSTSVQPSSSDSPKPDDTSPTCKSSSEPWASISRLERSKSRSEPRATGAAYPVWFIVPSSSKDASGDEGGTIQARITCKRPSAQTFPPEIKSCIQSRWVGGSIISMDLSQVELRVAALCSGDKSLLAAFNDGLDLHTDRAIQLFGSDSVSRPTFKKLERQVGKTMNFADLFLASPQRMRMSVHEMTGELMPLEFFEGVARSRPDARPGLHRWQQSLIHQVATNGHLILPLLGQSRTFVGGPGAHLNEVVNFPIQTQAGNTLLQIQGRLLKSLNSLATQGPRILMFLQVYDAIYFDVPPHQEDRLRDLIRQAVDEVTSPSGYWGQLQTFYGNTVPLEYEVD